MSSASASPQAASETNAARYLLQLIPLQATCCHTCVPAKGVVDACKGVQAVGHVLRLHLLQVVRHALQQRLKQALVVVAQRGAGPQRVAAVDGAEALHALQHLEVHVH